MLPSNSSSFENLSIKIKEHIIVVIIQILSSVSGFVVIIQILSCESGFVVIIQVLSCESGLKVDYNAYSYIRTLTIMHIVI